MRLLLVEDDEELLANLKRSLSYAGFAVDTSSDGIDAEFLGDTEPYDAVILDLGLPGRPGLDVLANWRSHNNDVPVLILTARGAWHEKVNGFNSGADDYLAKPFHMEELVARIRALIRRRHGQANPLIRAGDFALDTERQCVTLSDGESLELTGTEFRLLEYLMLHPDMVLSKSRLLEHIYSGETDSDENIIEVYIKRLRQKLGNECIETRRGQGYIFRSGS